MGNETETGVCFAEWGREREGSESKWKEKGESGSQKKTSNQFSQRVRGERNRMWKVRFVL